MRCRRVNRAAHTLGPARDWDISRPFATYISDSVHPILNGTSSRCLGDTLHPDSEVQHPALIPVDQLEEPKQHTRSSSVSTDTINEEFDPLLRELVILWTEYALDHPGVVGEATEGGRRNGRESAVCLVVN
jgi:hypothetical protein